MSGHSRIPEPLDLMHKEELRRIVYTAYMDCANEGLRLIRISLMGGFDEGGGPTTSLANALAVFTMLASMLDHSFDHITMSLEGKPAQLAAFEEFRAAGETAGAAFVQKAMERIGVLSMESLERAERRLEIRSASEAEKLGAKLLKVKP